MGDGSSHCRGARKTQRLAVLRAVAGHPHISADGAAEVVRAEIGAISLRSVYDALGLLVAEGLIRRIQPAGSAAASRTGSATTTTI
jgi:Fe2+ or Zn2+ uptake regulation protein